MWPCLWPCQTRLHTAVIARIARCRRPVESRAGVVELECAPETVLNMRQEIYHKPAEHFVGDGPSLFDISCAQHIHGCRSALARAVHVQLYTGMPRVQIQVLLPLRETQRDGDNVQCARLQQCAVGSDNAGHCKD